MLNNAAVQQLKSIVGADFVLCGADSTAPYLYDEVELPFRPAAALGSVVVKPNCTEQVSAIMRLATAERIPVVVRGGGTGLCGAATPIKDSIVICMERLNRIVEIDEQNMMAVLEAGVTLGDLLEELDKHPHICFPVHPGDEGAQMGGMVINNAGGARAVRHGITRNHIKGLRVVFADGEVADLGGKLLKDNAGYNLMQLIMGSEGTLAIVTQVILRLYPEEAFSASIVASFDSIDDASQTALGVVRSGASPLAVEYQDRRLNKDTADMLGLHWPVTEGSADLIFILSEKTEAALYETCRLIDAQCDAHHACQVKYAGTKQEQDDVLAIRSGSYDVIKDVIYHSFDMAVPPASVPGFLHDLWQLVSGYGTHTNITAHIADGNIHNDILLTEQGDVPDYHAVLKQQMYELCFKYGGTITGEHGVGKLRVRDLRLQKSAKELELMRGIKRAFDPLGLLNPGTVFAEE